MRKEVTKKERTVFDEVVKYISDDGREFETEEQCKAWESSLEKRLNSVLMDCLDCTDPYSHFYSDEFDSNVPKCVYELRGGDSGCTVVWKFSPKTEDDIVNFIAWIDKQDRWEARCDEAKKARVGKTYILYESDSEYFYEFMEVNEFLKEINEAVKKSFGLGGENG